MERQLKVVRTKEKFALRKRLREGKVWGYHGIHPFLQNIPGEVIITLDFDFIC